MSRSRLGGLHRRSIAERIVELERHGWLTAADAELLGQGSFVLPAPSADKMIENVIGVFGLPFAVAPNFVVNGRDYLVPMVVEEPSIVAGTSNSARLAAKTGGFDADCRESLLIGQVHVSGIDDRDIAAAAIESAREELLSLAKEVHPRLVERGGGLRDIETHPLKIAGERSALAVHLLVDTCDAMGANLVNTLCEALAPRIAELCGGKVALRILSNLADRSLVTARVRYDLAGLATPMFDAQTVRDRIVEASDIASADPYRAVTHNKGIMNGVDAVAVATGNDWRAIEAGAHAYAAWSGQYRPLATWSVAKDGCLLGELTLPLKVGIVGGTKDSNPAAGLGIRITGVDAATELAQLMAAVGLAQNFAALKALATSGIQAAHMKLHARSVAQAAGVPDERFDDVVREMIRDGNIKVWRARQLLSAAQPEPAAATRSVAAGKVILLGEHAAVYGKHALALPISGAVSASVTPVDVDPCVEIPEWGVFTPLAADDPTGIGAAIDLIMTSLDLADRQYCIRINASLPRAMGLGSSAALAVAVIRAFDLELGLGLDDTAVNELAFACEQLAHGTPSGIDNTLATFDQPMLFRHTDELHFRTLKLDRPPPVVIACTHSGGLTREQVAGVRERREQNPRCFDNIFEEIDGLSCEGADALIAADYARLGRLMNICHGLLNAIGVSTPDLEKLVSIARAAGAAGAKLTGAGGGGSIVALCPGKTAEVRNAIHQAGFRTLDLSPGSYENEK
jgi:hydroxymethylglutaryl-CoA reductase